MKVLFLGEDCLSGAGKYLAGILTWAGVEFDYVPDGTPVTAALLKKSYSSIILSDYCFSNFTKQTFPVFNTYRYKIQPCL